MKSRPGKMPLPLPLHRRGFLWLLAALTVAVSWHLPHLPLQVTAVMLGLIVLCYRRAITPKRPPWHLRLTLTAAAIAMVLVSHGTIWGKEAGISSLALLVFLKLFEAKSNGDLQVTAYIGLFLILAAVLYDQTLPVFLFMLVAMMLMSGVMRILQHPEMVTVPFRSLMRKMVVDFLLVLPVFFSLFLLFPRSSQPLFSGAFRFSSYFQSGFSDVIHPGSISRLAISRAPAFRVYFPPGRRPRPSDLYFRGVVLWNTDGRSWFHGSNYSFPVSEADMESGDIEYEILIESRASRWLFALDRPVRFPPWVRLNGASTFSSPTPISRPIRYSVASTLPAPPTTIPVLPPLIRKWSLQLPRRLDPRIRELGEEFRYRSDSDQQVIRAALAYFQENGFAYTLEPGSLDPDNPISDFLFFSRKGFCEHFAAAFALLMRSAGIPTRLVAGYLGGEDDPFGRFFLVREAEAHAWTEVWIENQGWVRVDPTTIVAPDRMSNRNLNGDSAGDQQAGSGSGGWRNGSVFRFFHRLWVKIVRLALTIEDLWNYWIVTFGRVEQETVLHRLAGEVISRQVGFWLLAIALVMMIVYYVMKRIDSRRTGKDSLVLLFDRYCRKLNRAGLAKKPTEGPIDFLTRSVGVIPEKSVDMERITRLYIELHYGRRLWLPRRERDLRRMIRRLRIKKSKGGNYDQRV